MLTRVTLFRAISTRRIRLWDKKKNHVYLRVGTPICVLEYNIISEGVANVAPGLKQNTNYAYAAPCACVP